MWTLIAGGWLFAVVAVVAIHRRELLAIWREPVLRYPVLIIESDDWGAGPVEAQADALNRIAEVLANHRDQTGRRPVIALTMILAVPDGPAISQDGRYHRRELDDPEFVDILEAIKSGRAAGVFSVQLHGLEHYWPATLMASNDPDVRMWLTSETWAATELLPSHLQSRWVDASSLPSMPLETAGLKAAVADEVRIYERIFGEKPRVVVPPTFVWTRTVEAAWAEEGVECVMTPGWRYTCRNAQGSPECEEGPIHNGDQEGVLTYLVRNDYFEPRRGRGSNHALLALDSCVAQGSPCLLENHRDNFVVGEHACEQSLAELDSLYQAALIRYGQLRFMSTEELSRVYSEADPAWIDTRFVGRLPAIIARLREARRFWKLATLIGLAWILVLSSRMLATSEIRYK